MYKYKTKGTCSREILFDVTADEKVKDVKFIGGCNGNLQAVSRLVEGKSVDQVIDTLKGIQCRAGTSCGDQLAKALLEYKAKKGLLEDNKD